MSLPERDKIHYVCMDMCEPYRQAVKSVLPQATVVIDKFHITRIANQYPEAARKNLRKSLSPKSRKALMHDRFILLKRQKDLKPTEVMILESWILNYPDLGKAYELKESFYVIWENYGLDGANTAYDQWRKQIPAHLNSDFVPLLTAMKNWQRVFV